MKFKNKGRKIYKTKEKNYYGKSPVGKVFSVGLSVLLIGGIGFIGYSVAEPIINYTKKKGDEQTTISSQTTTQPRTDSDGNIVTSNNRGSSGSENIQTNEEYKAFVLSYTDLAGADTLQSAIKKVPSDQGIEYVQVPLKISGGRIYYSSSVAMAIQSGAVQSNIGLSEIVNTIELAGYKPVAFVSTFDDNIVPEVFRDTGYKTIDDGSQWIDDNLESGGKPWMSPFSDSAVSYNADIVDEISSAGFDKIVCSDFIFPDFRETDVEYLGDSVVSSERYMALTSAANLLYERIMTNGSTMMLEVSAADLLQGKNDILKPMLLKVNTVVLNIDLDEIGYGVYTGETVYEFSGTPEENVSKMLDLVSREVEDFNVVVRISGATISTPELVKAVEGIKDHGFSSFVIG